MPGLYLKSVEQRDGELTIKGESPNEYSVTKFGQSIEFSSGLFTNLNIETQREAAQVGSSNSGGSAADADEAKPEVVNFTVKCTYAPAKQKSQSSATPPSTQVAMKK